MIISEKTRALAAQAERDCAEAFARIDAIAQQNAEKVLAAFQKYRVSETYFNGTTGYGYDDQGREMLDRVFAEVFGAEDGLVRVQFVNGTHTLTACLFGMLRPGDTLLSVMGAPYDTLCSAIGIQGDEPGNLLQFGIRYAQVDPTPAGEPDYAAIAEAAKDPTIKTILIQRSRGYSTRAALCIDQIRKICETIRSVNTAAYIMADNCYGEFCETLEPTEVGVDVMAGSLIKNPGGGLAPTGGYIVGKKELVEAAAMRLTCPGIGKECGCTQDVNRLFYQGFFLAPHVTAQAVKTAVFCARMMERLGFQTSPAHDAPRTDLVQTVQFGKPAAMKKFCLGIQMGAPVDSYVTPEPWDMPGYTDPVIMAAGSFVQGASIELSADGPMRAPYIAYLQGGLTYESGKIGVMLAVEELLKGE
ncbi:MAG: methionine gamma-lyase family protein [Oscillospiraceae bacterium]|nr:methionine gamma-lyase family protein [Oscillospiraceae bacterium]